MLPSDRTTGTLASLVRSSLRAHRPQIAALVTLQLVQTMATLYLPSLNADIVNHGVAAGDTGYISSRGLVMLAVAVLQIGCTAAAVYVASSTAMAVGRDLRSRVFTSVQGFSVREVDHFGASALLTRTTNDVQQVQSLAFLLLALAVAAPITAVGAAALALGEDVVLAGVLLAAVPVLTAVVGLVLRAMTTASRAMQARIDTANRILREQITGIRVIRAFVRDDREQRRFAETNTDLMRVSLQLGRLSAYVGMTAMLVANLSAIAVVWIGGRRLADGSTDVGALIAVLSYVSLTLTAVMTAMSVIVQAPRAKVSAERINEVLHTTPRITAPPTPVTVLPGPGTLEIRGATFGYPGAAEPVLRDVDLVARPGQTTAIIGATGSGKSTLVNLAPRLLDVDSGRVTIDGVDVRDLDRRLLTTTVGIVPQTAYLFAGSVASNLRFADPDADDAQLWHALEVAQARDFVEAMPLGLDTPIGQGGGTVSGGQRQRLAIARALVARARIYVFDDAFSALDAATDAALRAALETEIGDTTRIVVAQQVATVRDADRIVVLDRGQVVGSGTHDELTATNDVYAEILRSQLPALEVA